MESVGQAVKLVVLLDLEDDGTLLLRNVCPPIDTM
jgi:hypothetical protein